MWEHMTEQQYQHEVIVPDKGFPFKLFLFEGHSGKYIREKHWHRSIEIFAVQEGELDFILDTTHYHLGEGEFIIVNSNEVHAIHANRPNHTIVLQIPLNQFASYFTGEQFIWFSHSERTYDEQVACLIFRMYKVYRMQTDGYDFEILSMFYQLLHILVKKYRKLDVQDELLKSNQQLNRLGMITSYLKDHYMEDISLGKLAGIFEMCIRDSVGAGARTGLASIVTGLLFLLAIFFAPIFTAIPGFATAPALIFVGFLMVSAIVKVDFEDLTDAVPAYLCLIAMPLMYSIAEGIAIGVISFVLSLIHI